MHNQDELDREETWLKQLLRWGPRSGLPECGGKVCQICGEIGYFEDKPGEIAGHSEHWDFVGYGAGHEGCRTFGAAAAVGTRSWAFCELCRGRIDRSNATPVGRTWVCGRCDTRFEDCDLPSIASDLAFRRFVGRRSDERKGPYRTDIQLELLKLERGRPFEPPQLPEGLTRCSECGKARGETFRASTTGEVFAAKSTCLCEGIRCSGCRELRIPRPISDHFDPDRGGWWHVPYFVGMVKTCRSCRNREASGDAF